MYLPHRCDAPPTYLTARPGAKVRQVGGVVIFDDMYFEFLGALENMDICVDADRPVPHFRSEWGLKTQPAFLANLKLR